MIKTFNNKVNTENVIMTSSVGTLIPVVKTWDATGKILTINPTVDLSAATMYLVNIIGVVDIYNQTLTPSVVNFTTA